MTNLYPAGVHSLSLQCTSDPNNSLSTSSYDHVLGVDNDLQTNQRVLSILISPSLSLLLQWTRKQYNMIQSGKVAMLPQ